MSLRPLRVVFEIDAEGIIYDPFCPIHLDELIDWALSPMVRTRPAPTRTEAPEEIKLPLGTWHREGEWGWCASALFPINTDAGEDLRYIRKKVRTNRATMTTGIINLKSGITREWNVPLTVQMCREFEAWCLGDRHRIDDLLRRNLRYLGRKRHRGFGRIENLRVEVCEEDFSLKKDGVAMRWLPMKDALRLVRPRPPYWNLVGRVPSCEVGESI